MQSGTSISIYIWARKLFSSVYMVKKYTILCNIIPTHIIDEVLWIIKNIQVNSFQAIQYLIAVHTKVFK